jgi:hypothetical protein
MERLTKTKIEQMLEYQDQWARDYRETRKAVKLAKNRAEKARVKEKLDAEKI